jgi:hypothetical protein
MRLRAVICATRLAELGGQVVHASVSKLPAHASLNRRTLVTTTGSRVAITSKPTDHNNNFTITDSGRSGGQISRL